MPPEIKSALDAVNAAVTPPEPAASTPPAAEPKEDETEGGERTDEEDGGEEGGEPVGEPAKKPDGDEPAADSKPAADKSAKGAAEPATKADGEKPAGEAKPDSGKPAEKKAAEPKAADPLNDPIPAQVSERTRERITSLITMVKERDAEVQQGRELFEQIASTGMQPEELATMLGYSRLIHSDNIEDRRTAFKFLQGELRALALQLGETAAGVNLLDDYPDLKEKLEAGQLTEADANEIALSRERAKQATENTRRQAQTEEQARAEHAAGSAALTELGNTLRAVDPNYAAKAAILVPKLQPVLKTMHPSKWREHFLTEYQNLKLSAAPAGGDASAPAGDPPAGGDRPQPLRPNKQPSGQGSKAPSSALEAMSAALDNMGR